ncbi:hypothetical protein OXV71_04355 [Bacteroides fragilis]|nr:hypothetical protein [Bacteroides fragilis]
MADKKEQELTVTNDCEWIRGLDTNGNSIKINKTDLASILKGRLGIIERVLIPSGESGAKWYRIMELDNYSNASFLLSLMTFANAAQSLMLGYASVYENVSICILSN